MGTQSKGLMLLARRMVPPRDASDTAGSLEVGWIKCSAEERTMGGIFRWSGSKGAYVSRTL